METPPKALPAIEALLDEHVTLTVECLDRLYLNGYVPGLQTEAGFVGFLTRHMQFFSGCLARPPGAAFKGPPSDRDYVQFQYSGQPVFVKHYYFHLDDARFGFRNATPASCWFGFQNYRSSSLTIPAKA